MPRALITGVSGQDGSYLAELLAGKGYDVHGTVRPELLDQPELLPKFLVAFGNRVTLHPGKLEEPQRYAALIRDIAFDECYHLAGPGAVDSDLLGDPRIFSSIVQSTKAMLAAIEENRKRCRFFFAGSAEMFGRASSSPQDEDTPFQPRSLYGLAKLAGFHAVRQFRRRSGGFACTGILYNHESPRRSTAFLPRKVSLAVARIKLGMQTRLVLGNLDAVRDWGYAPDFVQAIWLMLQQAEPRDFVIATGRTHRVEERVGIAFKVVGLAYRDYIEIDPRLYRPTEAIPLCGNPSRIAQAVGWRSKTPFDHILAEMIKNDLTEQSSLHRSQPELS